MDIKKELFEIIQDNKNQFDLYEKLITYVNNTILEVRGLENAEFYEVLFTLMNSINNAGWEDKHFQNIETIRKAMHKINDRYDKFLP